MRKSADKFVFLYDTPTAEQVAFFSSSNAAMAIQTLAGNDTGITQLLNFELSKIR